jgi:xanthine dehydrogenase YagS FAD-binding subunit
VNDLRLVAATSATDALRLFTAHGATPAYLAGGTTVVDLMKLGVMAPDLLIDLQELRAHHAGVRAEAGEVVVGALTTMAEAAAHPLLAARAPAVVDALRLAASPQIRNAATIGGNLLQRTRCPWFRDGRSPCNKRRPGTGCSATGGDTRSLAVLGTSGACIANYPGDLAVALTALGAHVDTLSGDGHGRRIPVGDLHRLPQDRPDLETVLEPGELLTAVRVPDDAWDASLYVKVRDRASYAFALTSAAVALRRDGDLVGDVRIAVGGAAAVPWRCRTAEDLLRGAVLTPERAAAAGAECYRSSRADSARAFKVDLGARTVLRALLDAWSRAQAARGGA